MTDPRIIALPSSPGQVEPGPFSEHDLREQWNAQADELNQWESLDSSEQLAWAQTRAIAADRFLPPVAKPTPVDLTALHDPDFSGGLTPDQHLEVLWGGPDSRVAATTHTIPVAWCRSDDFSDAAQKRQSFSGWRDPHSDCDMALYAHPQASATAPAADQAEGPSLADVAELCEEFGFTLDPAGGTVAVLQAMITAAISRWRAPVAQPVATPPLPPRVGHILRLAEIIREVDGKHDLGAAALAEAILAHPGFSGCHDGPAALPAQDTTQPNQEDSNG